MEPVLTKNIRPGQEPLMLPEYERAGGYQAFRKAVTQHTPDELRKMVLDSGLRGRGGAGFPTGIKWNAMPPIEDSRRPRYIAVNFDEMEPGTFKDRFLVEGDPHQLIEGILITAWACQCDVGYIFIRWAYKRPQELLARAVAEAESAGYIGKNILGSGWDFALHNHISAGRYICGEETGMLNALEGKRGNPRAKPPYPMTSGAWGMPTLVNNVETLCNVPHIVMNGVDWYKSIGKARDSGPKIYGASGRVKNPRCVELPMGTTSRELIEEHMGGMQDGYRMRGVLPGGASTRFLGPEHWDVPLDFESMKEIRAFLGTGTAIVLDDRSCIVDVNRNLQKFYARESCGWCTPCREGLPWMEEILTDMEEGRGKPGDVDLLLENMKHIGSNSFCALATGAAFPLESSIELFRDEFEEHIGLGKCPMKP